MFQGKPYSMFDPKVRPKLTCNICGHSVQSESGLRRHRKNQHGSDPKVRPKLSCNICGHTVRSESGLQRHRKNQHGLASNKTKLSSCPRCFHLKSLFLRGTQPGPISTTRFDGFKDGGAGVCAACDRVNKALLRV